MDKLSKIIINALSGGIKEFIHPWSAPTGDRDASGFEISRHEELEFMFVVRGTCRYFYNGSVYLARPGTLFLIDSMVPHAYQYRQEDHGIIHFWGRASNDDFFFNIFMLKTPGSGRFIRQFSYQALPLAIEVLLEKRLKELKKLKSFTADDACRYLKGTLALLLDEAALLLERRPAKPMLDIAGRIKVFIRSRNGKACSLDNLADFCGMSRYYVAHRFHQETGMTIGAYIDEVRIKYTIHALQKGLRQKEIADELGFGSVNAFWNWKKKHNMLLGEARGFYMPPREILPGGGLREPR